MRFGEAADLRRSDFDLSRVVVVDKTKTREPRPWKLGEDVVRAFTAWVESMPNDGPQALIFLDELRAPFVGKKLAMASVNSPQSCTTGRAFPISPGWSPRLDLSPTPNSPAVLLPQHLIVALSSSAQACREPVTTLTAVRPVPRSSTGRPSPMSDGELPRLTISPAPSCPLAL
jgi:hypothetical protein